VSLVALGLSGAALVITWREHRWRAEDRERRAILRIGIAPVGADKDGTLRTRAESLSPMIRVRVENTGDRSADGVTLRVYIPDRFVTFGWTDGDGSRLPGAPGPGMSVRLTDADGREWPARPLERIIDHLAHDDHYDAFFHFRLPLAIGAGHVPIRAVARSASLGLGVGPITENHSLRVERLRESADDQ
jgi:hypothetical protein